MEGDVVIFGDKSIRRTLVKVPQNGHDSGEPEWFFSVVDIVGILSGSLNSRDYWYRVKARELENGVQLSTICRQLKLEAPDGKMRETDCADLKGIFRIIQSIPSKKAEPFKLWLAKVGSDRVEEIHDPELAQERMKKVYEKKGYSKSWIDKRLRGIAVRQDLTDEWKRRGIEDHGDFAILTAEISRAAFGMVPAEYKKLKGLGRENLRDHMTDLELIFSMLGEASTAELEKVRDPDNFEEHRDVAVEGGSVAGNARRDLERKSGERVVSEDNYLSKKEREVGERKKDLIELE